MERDGSVVVLWKPERFFDMQGDYEVIKVPPSEQIPQSGRTHGQFKNMVLAFIESGQDRVKIRSIDSGKMAVARACIYKVIKRNGLPVAVKQRGADIWLERKT